MPLYVWCGSLYIDLFLNLAWPLSLHNADLQCSESFIYIIHFKYFMNFKIIIFNLRSRFQAHLFFFSFRNIIISPILHLLSVFSLFSLPDAYSQAAIRRPLLHWFRTLDFALIISIAEFCSTNDILCSIQNYLNHSSIQSSLDSLFRLPCCPFDSSFWFFCERLDIDIDIDIY